MAATELIHINVAAEWLGLDYSRAEGLVERPKLAGVILGGRMYVPTDALVDYSLATAGRL